MEIEFDTNKNQSNIAKHGISFEQIDELDFNSIIATEDNRFEYGESRYIAYAMMNRRLYCLIYTRREGNLHPISFRKANKKEVKDYEKIINA